MQGGVVLIPTYNERANIEALIPEVLSRTPLFIMVIDDNSPDGTGSYVEALLSRESRLSLLKREKKEGLGLAYKQGVKAALENGFDPIVFMDADGSHGVEALPILLEKSKEYELVIGSRYMKGGGIEKWEWWRHLLSFFGNLYTRILTGLPLHDITAGYVCIRAAALRRIDLSKVEASGYAFQIDLKYRLVKAGARTCEVPILFHARREGESKISRHIVLEGLGTPLKLFRERLFTR